MVQKVSVHPSKCYSIHRHFRCLLYQPWQQVWKVLQVKSCGFTKEYPTSSLRCDCQVSIDFWPSSMSANLKPPCWYLQWSPTYDNRYRWFILTMPRHTVLQSYVPASMKNWNICLTKLNSSSWYFTHPSNLVISRFEKDKQIWGRELLLRFLSAKFGTEWSL